MITLNTSTKIPGNVKLWMFIRGICVLLFISFPLGLLIGSFIEVFIFLTIFMGLPVWIYIILSLNNISFSIDDNKITINRGILMKHSNSITFDKIQNVECSNGPIMNFFNISQLNLWTASPSQIIIQRGRSENQAVESLLLNSADAFWLKEYILGKHSKI